MTTGNGKTDDPAAPADEDSTDGAGQPIGGGVIPANREDDDKDEREKDAGSGAP